MQRLEDLLPAAGSTPLDLLIAATALDADLTLVTRNVRHFERIAELKLYQPS
jgi:predicted nucleic acid-binding protein